MKSSESAAVAIPALAIYKVLGAALGLGVFSLEQLMLASGESAEMVSGILTEYSSSIDRNGKTCVINGHGQSVLKECLEAAYLEMRGDRKTSSATASISEMLVSAHNRLTRDFTSATDSAQRSRILESIRYELAGIRKRIVVVRGSVTAEQFEDIYGGFQRLEDTWRSAALRCSDYQARLAGQLPVPQRIVLRSADYLRSGLLGDRGMIQDDGELIRLERHEEEIVKVLQDNGQMCVTLHGDPGSGKSYVARRLIGFLTQEGTGFLIANIYEANCADFTVFSDIAAVLASGVDSTVAKSLPEDISDRMDVLVDKLTRNALEGQPILILLDNLDDIQAKPKEFALLFEFLEALAARTISLRVIITVSDWLQAANNQYLERLKHRNFPALPQQVTGSAREGYENPLAIRLLLPIAGRNYRESQMADFESLKRSVPDACAVSWATLSPVQQDLLQRFTQLPGGFRISLSSDSDSLAERVVFEGLGASESLYSLLSALTEVGWLECVVDNSDVMEDSCVFYLRRVLRSFVLGNMDVGRLASICLQSVHFWAKLLKRWGSILADTVIDKVQPTRLDRFIDNERLLEEERARYFIDVNRLNWCLAFYNIAHYTKGIQVATLQRRFLTGVARYCRATFRQTMFVEMCVHALSSYDESLYDSSMSQWRRRGGALQKGEFLFLMGSAQRRLGKYSDAAWTFDASLNLMRSDSTSQNSSRCVKLSRLLLQLGRTNHWLGRWSVAGENLRCALKVSLGLKESEALPNSDVLCALTTASWSDTRRHAVASCIGGYANYLNDTFDWDIAENLHRRALELREELAETGPFYSRRYVADSHNDLGNTCFYKGKYIEAIKNYKRALQIRECLVSGESGALAEYVAKTLNNLGNCWRKSGEWAVAEKLLERAVGIYENACREFPPKFYSLLARTLTNLGRVKYHQGRLHEALQLFQRADTYHERACSFVRNPVKWVETCNFLALAYIDLHAGARAMQFVLKAENLLPDVKAVSTRQHEMLLAYTLDNKARVLISSDRKSDWELARDYLAQSEVLRYESLRWFPENRQFVLHMAQLYHDYGMAFRKLGLAKEARIKLDKALEMRREFGQQNARYTERLIAKTVAELAEVDMLDGDSESALDKWNKAIDKLRQLQGENVTAYTRQISDIQKRISETRGEVNNSGRKTVSSRFQHSTALKL